MRAVLSQTQIDHEEVVSFDGGGCYHVLEYLFYPVIHEFVLNNWHGRPWLPGVLLSIACEQRRSSSDYPGSEIRKTAGRVRGKGGTPLSV